MAFYPRYTWAYGQRLAASSLQRVHRQDPQPMRSGLRLLLHVRDGGPVLAGSAAPHVDGDRGRTACASVSTPGGTACRVSALILHGGEPLLAGPRADFRPGGVRDAAGAACRGRQCADQRGWPGRLLSAAFRRTRRADRREPGRQCPGARPAPPISQRTGEPRGGRGRSEAVNRPVTGTYSAGCCAPSTSATTRCDL